MSRHSEEKKNKKGLKTFGIIVLVLLIILAIIVGGTFAFVHSKLSKMQQVDLNEDDLNVSAQAEQQLAEYRNIAIFGVDSRDDSYDKGNRSDCIIIASINNKTKEVKLISVYRDTYVQIEGHGLDKITHAYSYGEAPLAIKTLNTNLDLNIKEFATVNFDVVKETVDYIGGISMPITSEEVGHISGITKPGTYTLTGEQALAYSRIRHASGGDYKRTERMRDVLTAVTNKVKTLNISQLNGFVDTILPKVYTNITSADIFSMMPSIASYKITDSIGWPYETKGITLDRWYGIPVTLENNVKRLHQEAFDEADYTPSEKVKDISNQIIQKTGYSK
jgi:transcriptional regulator